MYVSMTPILWGCDHRYMGAVDTGVLSQVENEKLPEDPEFGLTQSQIIPQTMNALAGPSGGENCGLF